MLFLGQLLRSRVFWGTQPIMYSIADVTSTDGNADLFKEELVMQGGWANATSRLPVKLPKEPIVLQLL